MGCNVLSNSYSITIDPAFSRGQKADIIAAVEEWENQLPGVLTILAISTGPCTGAGRELCIHRSTLAAVTAQIDAINPNYSHTGTYLANTRRDRFMDKAETDVSDDYDSTFSGHTFQQVIAHELGHALGLEHIAGHNLMYWSTVDWSPTLTCDDVAQYLSLRSISTVTAQCPHGGSFTYYH
jgi:hypothetical protein